jgi:hypothetical protein
LHQALSTLSSLLALADGRRRRESTVEGFVLLRESRGLGAPLPGHPSPAADGVGVLAQHPAELPCPLTPSLDPDRRDQLPQPSGLTVLSPAAQHARSTTFRARQTSARNAAVSNLARSSPVLLPRRSTKGRPSSGSRFRSLPHHGSFSRVVTFVSPSYHQTVGTV